MYAALFAKQEDGTLQELAVSGYKRAEFAPGKPWEFPHPTSDWGKISAVGLASSEHEKCFRFFEVEYTTYAVNQAIVLAHAIWTASEDVTTLMMKPYRVYGAYLVGLQDSFG